MQPIHQPACLRKSAASLAIILTIVAGVIFLVEPALLLWTGELISLAVLILAGMLWLSRADELLTDSALCLPD